MRYDGVNGSKCSKSKQFYFVEPTLNDLNKRENKEIENIKSSLNQSISLAQEIEKEIQELNELYKLEELDGKKRKSKKYSKQTKRT